MKKILIPTDFSQHAEYALKVAAQIAKKHNVSTGAICLQFALQQGICILPKSATPSRIIENYSVDFELEQQDIDAIKSMPETGFSGLHPDEVGF